MKPFALFGRFFHSLVTVMAIAVAFTALAAFSCNTPKPRAHEAIKPLPRAEVFLDPQTPSGSGTLITVRGRVAVFGNEPHAYVGIEREDGSATYAVYPPSKERELLRLQGHLVDFSGVLLDEPRGEGSLYLRSGTIDPLSWKIVN